MKRFLTLCLLLAVVSSASAQEGKKEMPSRKAFSNVGLSVGASTSGIGVNLATPLTRSFTLRAGYNFSPFSYDYTYDEFDPVTVQGSSVPVPAIDLTADLNFNAGQVMIDWVPFKKGRGTFFITAGLVFGSDQVIKVNGQFDPNDPDYRKIQQAGLLNEIEIEVGDQLVRPNADGSMDAALKVKGMHPYVGIGWGRAIPKHRLGFRFEVGAQLLGTPEIVSGNLVQGDVDELSDFNKILKDLNFYPNISFQLTYRLFKDK